MHFKSIIISERSHVQKTVRFHLQETLEKEKTKTKNLQKQEVDQRLPGAWAEGERIICREIKGNFLG